MDDLAKLKEALGNSPDLPLSVIEVDIEHTKAYEQIKDLSKTSDQTPQAVCKYLRETPLFKFLGYRLHNIK